MQTVLSSSARLQKLGQLDVISVNNDQATAQIALFGAHIVSFVPKQDARERLWLSSDAILDGSKAIRGGVPICWPWFSDSHGKPDLSLPSHGYVRDQTWQLSECVDTDDGTELTLVPGTTKGRGFDGDAQLSIKIKVGAQLHIWLTTENLGSTPFSITCALHTYFNVTDINHTKLRGLSGSYKDKTLNWQQFTTPEPYTFHQETDRIHLCRANKVSIEDRQQGTLIESAGHDSLVVWNPWSTLSQSMQDMQDDGYRYMLCVETAVTDNKEIAPGQAHTLTQIIS